MKKYLLLAVLLLGSATVCSAKISEKAKDPKPVAEKAPAPVVAEVKAPAAPAAPVDDRLAALRQRMANNASLKDADQAALAAAMSAHFTAGTDLRALANEKAMLYFEGVANDPNMKVNEKLDLIKKYDPKAMPAEKTAETAEPVKAVVEAKAPKKTEKKSGFSFFKK